MEHELATAMVAYRALINRKLTLEADPDHDPGDYELAVFMLSLVDSYLQRAWGLDEEGS